MKIEYHPFIADDLISAEIHYDELQPGLAKALKAEVFQTIERIREALFVCRGQRRPSRTVKAFPFSIIYRILSNDTIRILLIRHHKRHPAFGSGRQ